MTTVNAAQLIDLGTLPGGALFTTGRGISADGTVVVGVNRVDGLNMAFRWTQSTGMVGLGVIPGSAPNSFPSSSAYAASAAGSVVVGQASDTVSGSQAFRWTQSTGMVGLGDLAGGSFRSTAYGVSADGSVVVGQGISASGFEAFGWTEGTGMVGLGDLAGGAFFSTARDVSADGLVVVGQSSSASGTEAFRWTEGTGMVGLGDFEGGEFASSVSGVSADGSVIVGTGNSGLGTEAFIRDSANGMQSLAAVLENQGVDLTGFLSISTRDISADGRSILVTGVELDRIGRAYLAVLDPGAIPPVLPPSAIPVPSAVWLFGSGLLGVVGMARRKKEA